MHRSSSQKSITGKKVSAKKPRVWEINMEYERISRKSIIKYQEMRVTKPSATEPSKETNMWFICLHRPIKLHRNEECRNFHSENLRQAP